jgi:hypothetical protein
VGRVKEVSDGSETVGTGESVEGFADVDVAVDIFGVVDIVEVLGLV